MQKRLSTITISGGYTASRDFFATSEQQLAACVIWKSLEDLAGKLPPFDRKYEDLFAQDAYDFWFESEWAYWWLEAAGIQPEPFIKAVRRAYKQRDLSSILERLQGARRPYRTRR